MAINHQGAILNIALSQLSLDIASLLVK